MQRDNLGYTLIELVVFIAVVGIMVAGVFGPINNVLLHAPHNLKQTTALDIAQTRMDLLLNQARYRGFDSVSVFNDPCQPPIDCTPIGLVVNFSVSTGWTGDPGNTDYKTITVTVNGDGAATLTALIAR